MDTGMAMLLLGDLCPSRSPCQHWQEEHYAWNLGISQDHSRHSRNVQSSSRQFSKQFSNWQLSSRKISCRWLSRRCNRGSTRRCSGRFSSRQLGSRRFSSRELINGKLTNMRITPMRFNSDNKPTSSINRHCSSIVPSNR